MNVRVGVYLRQSLDRAKDGAAVDRQREACDHLLSSRERDGWSKVGEYVDNDVSASGKVRRPEFERMMADLDAGRIDVVVAYHVDRLTRNLADFVRIVDVCERTGRKIATVSGDLDLTTDAGQTVAGLLAVVARGEIKRKGQRQRDANRQKAERGLPGSGPRPFGYAANRVDLDRDAAEIVRRMYKWFLAGRTLVGIARDLNVAGSRTVAGNQWSHGAVRQILSNPRYAGLRYLNKEPVGRAVWPAIVSEEVWGTVQAMLKARSRRYSEGRGARVYLLSGVAECGVCGDGTVLSVTQTLGANQGYSPAYACRPRNFAEQGRAKSGHLSRKVHMVDPYVEKLIIARLSCPDAVELLHDEDRPDIEALRAEALTLRGRRDEAVALFTDGGINATMLRDITERLDGRMEALEQQMAHVDRGPVLADLVNADDVATMWQGLPLDRKQAVIKALCSVTVYKQRAGGNRRNGGLGVLDPATVIVDFHQRCGHAECEAEQAA